MLVRALGYSGSRSPAGVVLVRAVGYSGSRSPAGAVLVRALGYSGFRSPAGVVLVRALGYSGFGSPALEADGVSLSDTAKRVGSCFHGSAVTKPMTG